MHHDVAIFALSGFSRAAYYSDSDLVVMISALAAMNPDLVVLTVLFAEMSLFVEMSDHRIAVVRHDDHSLPAAVPASSTPSALCAAVELLPGFRDSGLDVHPDYLDPDPSPARQRQGPRRLMRKGLQPLLQTWNS